jgi:hypothetical protein
VAAGAYRVWPLDKDGNFLLPLSKINAGNDATRALSAKVITPKEVEPLQNEAERAPPSVQAPVGSPTTMPIEKADDRPSIEAPHAEADKAGARDRTGNGDNGGNGDAKEPIATKTKAPASDADAASSVDANAQELTADSIAPDPATPTAVDIYFGILDSSQPPPKDQADLQDKVQKVLRAVQLLYRGTDAESSRNQRQFRSCYVRLYRLAQLGLEGKNVSPEAAGAALSSVTADLIDDEAGNVKRTHLRVLGCDGLVLGACCMAIYLFLRLTSAYWTQLNSFLVTIGIQSVLLANFMLLLVGCFLGVWLSYGIRTTTFTLSDLTVTDADRLTPLIRLIFAGSLAVILGIVLVIPLVEVTLGKISVTDIATRPMLAFIVGCFCGISELALPNAVAKRASDFIENIK